MKPIDKNDLMKIICGKVLKSDNPEAHRIADEILEKIYSNGKEIESEPVLVGTLTRAQGYKGFHKIEIGTPVYELDGKYFMIQISETDGSPSRQFYYKESLTPVIKFNESK